MKTYEKGFLMIAGTLAPAFLITYAVSKIAKKPITKDSALFLITFAASSALFGWYTARVIKKTN